MAANQLLSRLNGVVSCVVTVLMCLAVGATAFQCGPAAISYVRELYQPKPVEMPYVSYKPFVPTAESYFSQHPFEPMDQMVDQDIGAIIGRNASQRAIGDVDRAMRASQHPYRP